MLGYRVLSFHGSDPTDRKDEGGVLSFLNVRAAAYWRLREALDPSSRTPLALPPSRDLRVELCAARYSAEDRTIRLEKKEKIRARLGRSPDLADAVVMAYWDDPKARVAEAIVRAHTAPGPFGRPSRSSVGPARRPWGHA